MTTRRVTTGIGLIGAAAAATISAAQPLFQGLGDLPGGLHDSEALAVSSDGAVVVGQSRYHQHWAEAFRWTPDEGMIGLGLLDPDHLHSGANAVAADGSAIAGHSAYHHAFRWTAPDGMSPLGDLPGGYNESYARAISADGATIYGASSSAKGKEAAFWTEDQGWTGLGMFLGEGNATSTFLAAAPGGPFAVGYTYNPYPVPRVPWRWSHENGFEALAGQAVPAAVADSGWPVVGATMKAGWVIGYAAIWSADGSFRTIDPLGGKEPACAFTGVSGDGRLVVGWSTWTVSTQAVVWTEASGMRRLRTVLDGLGVDDVKGWVLLRAGAISADGSTIVGTGVNPDGKIEAWRAVLPPLCDADLNADFRLDLMDFLAFIDHFLDESPAADCDSNGLLDLFDFLCFAEAFNGGCQ